MEALKKFNQIGQCQNIPKIKINDLEKGNSYQIQKLEIIDTRYGKRIIVTLKFEKDEFKVFLPDRFGKKLDEKDIKKLNSQKLTLVYNGLKDLKDDKKFHVLEFHEIINDDKKESDSNEEEYDTDASF